MKAGLVALAPFLPLGALLAALLGVAAITPWDEARTAANPGLPAASAADAGEDEERPRGYVRPTTLATVVAWEVTALERSAAMVGRSKWYVVAYTDGAGVHLRSRPILSYERQLLPEGALVAEVSVLIDPSWKHVWVAPDGPSGYIPSEFASEMP